MADELAAIRLSQVLAEYEVRDALQSFTDEQAAFYRQQCVSEIGKREPDVLKAAQHAGRLDAYEHMMSELDFYLKNHSGN